MDALNAFGPWVLIGLGSLHLLWAGPLYGPCIRFRTRVIQLLKKQFEKLEASKDFSSSLLQSIASRLLSLEEKMSVITTSRWWIVGGAILFIGAGVWWKLN